MLYFSNTKKEAIDTNPRNDIETILFIHFDSARNVFSIGFLLDVHTTQRASKISNVRHNRMPITILAQVGKYYMSLCSKIVRRE